MTTATKENDMTEAKRLSDLRDVTKVQLANGNWNYDPYMHGLANGLIMALATIEGTEPEFLKATEKWLRDHVNDPTPTTMQAQ